MLDDTTPQLYRLIDIKAKLFVRYVLQTAYLAEKKNIRFKSCGSTLRYRICPEFTPIPKSGLNIRPD